MNTDSLNIEWWRQLSIEWKRAFAETFFRHVNEPSPIELARLYSVPALRFAGPSAPYPNMSFELNDLEALRSLVHLEILVVIFHQIQTVQELASLHNLKSLFLYNNKICSLKGIEELTGLTQLYVQCNKVASIEPVQKLTNLKEFYVHNNQLSSLRGLTEAHSENLESFFCSPNEGLKQKELLRAERELGVRCQSL